MYQATLDERRYQGPRRDFQSHCFGTIPFGGLWGVLGVVREVETWDACFAFLHYFFFLNPNAHIIQDDIHTYIT